MLAIRSLGLFVQDLWVLGLTCLHVVKCSIVGLQAMLAIRSLGLCIRDYRVLGLGPSYRACK